MSVGIALIKGERARQENEEGYSREHDAQHVHGELAQAGLCYLRLAYVQAVVPGAPLDCPIDWPWAPADWKPAVNRIRNLEKAGALVAAELDRIAWEEINT